ncbi:MAG: OmpP1/FadL family transporter [Candidatus Loosdrechtia sp.]|uniref:OmpP1/FadL family transporter n=1 Tax=Candidatus Loosdrechtia sp. TaxID=3101272 RepID=UPI003A683FDE|nr:MAG: outer membrane protein transport protein [Candidatus Jettenia sp. AMX2]
MKKNDLFLPALLALLSAFLFVSLCFFTTKDTFAQIASGLHNPVLGASALAQGNAFAARADDASAITFNPAGITQLQRPEVSLGMSAVYANVKYRGININEGRREDMDTIIGIPNLYFAAPLIKDKLSAGIGVTVPYGLNGKWNENGFSRFVVTEFDLTILNINPTIAFRPLPSLSFGAGPSYYYAETELKSRVPPEGFRKLDIDGDAFGYNAGMLYQITPSHSVGISFRSKADINLSGKLNLWNLSAQPPEISSRAKTTLTLPEMLTFGYAYRHGTRWSMEANVQWTNWSRFDILRVETDPFLGDIEDVRKWENTLGFAMGGEYALSEAVKVRGGYAFHETPVPSVTFEPSVPQSSRHALFTGLEYRWGENLNKWIDIAYGIVFYEKRTIDNAVGELVPEETIDGRYDLLTHLFAINFNYRF